MGVEAWTQRNHDGCRCEPKRNSQGYGVPGVFTCGADPASPKGACDGRDDAAADSALGDGDHERDQRKYRRDTGKGIDACSRYEIDLKRPMRIWTVITAALGNASRRIVGAIGFSSSMWVRGSTAAG